MRKFFLLYGTVFSLVVALASGGAMAASAAPSAPDHQKGPQAAEVVKVQARLDHPGASRGTPQGSTSNVLAADPIEDTVPKPWGTLVATLVLMGAIAVRRYGSAKS